MAFKTVATIRDSVQAILTGINLNNVENLNGAFERSARWLASLISIHESDAQSQITLYDGVTDYIAPTNIFGSALKDFRPQGISRNSNDFVYKQPIALFDRTKADLGNGTQLTFEYVNGVGRIRIVSDRATPRINLDSMTDDTGWAAAGSAGSLVDDETVFWQKPGSLRFTLTGSSTGTLTKTISGADLTDYIGVGVVFLAIRTPNVSNLTNIVIRLGSDSSNYYEVTETEGFLGAWVIDDWLLVALDLSAATTTGTPTDTAIDYAQVRIAHTATITNFYLGGMWISLPSPNTLIYSTASIFKASGANPIQTITATTDSILLTDQALVIYEYLTAKVIAFQQGGTLASGIISGIDSILFGNPLATTPQERTGLIGIYRGKNPSEELTSIGNWYSD